MEDPEELAAAQAGSPEAFGRLMRRFQPKVLGFLTSYTGREDVADELAQRAFIKAWRALARFRGECALETWLFQIALNEVRSWGRREKIRRLREWALGPLGTGDEEEDPPQVHPDRHPGSDPAGAADRSDLGRRLAGLVAGLPPGERQVFLLRHEQGLPLAEIARVLGRAEGTIKAHLFHALAKLRRNLEEEHVL